MINYRMPFDQTTLLGYLKNVFYGMTGGVLAMTSISCASSFYCGACEYADAFFWDWNASFDKTIMLVKSKTASLVEIKRALAASIRYHTIILK